MAADPRSPPPGPAGPRGQRALRQPADRGLDGQLGLTRDGAGFTHSQAIAAIARITGGSFRLLRRLFARIERTLRTSDLTVITSEVIEAARSTLVIGDAT